MLSGRLLTKTCPRYNRAMSFLVATEEFPLRTDYTLQPWIPVAPTIKEIILPNGIKIISRDNTDNGSKSGIATVQISILGGSAAEKASEKGAAHLLSVAAFAGSKMASGLRLVRDLENLGTVFKASADKQKVTYEFSAAKEAIAPAFKAIAQAIIFPAFAPSSTSEPSDGAQYLLTENKPVAEIAYERYAGDAHAQLIELLQEAAFGDGSPLGAPLLSSNLSSLEPASVLAYRSVTVAAPNVVVSANGVGHKMLTSLVEDYLKDLPSAKADTVSLPSATYVGGVVKARNNIGGKTALGLAFPMPSGKAGEPYPVLLNVIDTKLASLAKSKGLRPEAYVTTFSLPYASGGIFGLIVAGEVTTSGQYLAEAVQAVKDIATSSSLDITAAKAKAALERALRADSGDVLDSAFNKWLTSSALSGVSSTAIAAAATAALKSVPAFAVLGSSVGVQVYNKPILQV